jgi:hypothetical protein
VDFVEHRAEAARRSCLREPHRLEPRDRRKIAVVDRMDDMRGCGALPGRIRRLRENRRQQPRAAHLHETRVQSRTRVQQLAKLRPVASRGDEIVGRVASHVLTDHLLRLAGDRAAACHGDAERFDPDHRERSRLDGIDEANGAVGDVKMRPDALGRRTWRFEQIVGFFERVRIHRRLERTGMPAVSALGAHDRAARRPAEECRAHEGADDVLASGAVHVPEPRRLRRREAQAGHLEEFTADAFDEHVIVHDAELHVPAADRSAAGCQLGEQDANHSTARPVHRRIRGRIH